MKSINAWARIGEDGILNVNRLYATEDEAKFYANYWGTDTPQPVLAVEIRVKDEGRPKSPQLETLGVRGGGVERTTRRSPDKVLRKGKNKRVRRST